MKKLTITLNLDGHENTPGLLASDVEINAKQLSRDEIEQVMSMWSSQLDPVLMGKLRRLTREPLKKNIVVAKAMGQLSKEEGDELKSWLGRTDRPSVGEIMEDCDSEEQAAQILVKYVFLSREARQDMEA